MKTAAELIYQLEHEINVRDEIIARISQALTGNNQPTPDEIRDLPSIAERLTLEMTHAIAEAKTEAE